MISKLPLRLGVNIDHVATLRNARGGAHPCPVRAAQAAAAAGAEGITAHLREDRRHVRDADVERLKNEVSLPLNLEMAATEEMLGIARRVRPAWCCLVPEKRAELTTEGGLDVAAQEAALTAFNAALREAGIRVSLFVDADSRQVAAAARTGAEAVELHTGTYAHAEGAAREGALAALRSASAEARALGLRVHAGHGLDYENTAAVAAIPEIEELNIGHFLIGEAVFSGLEAAVRRMRAIMEGARG